MVALTEGSIALVRFPFSDLSSTKLRPSVVLASVSQNDWILCQVTSNPYSDVAAIKIDETDFNTGSLKRISFARPGKLFTADESVIISEAGVLKDHVFNSILNSVITVFENSKKP